MDFDESFPADLPSREVASFLADQKFRHLSELCTDKEVLITSDTVVVLKGQILGKPENREQAEQMLHNLSGQTHEVITGVTIGTKNNPRTFSDFSEVRFKALTPEEIDFYISTFQPFDKAASYGIQEWIGMIGIEWMAGSYFTVMGFPVHHIYQHLKKYWT